MTHVLAFSQLLYSFYATGQFKTTSKGSYLTGPYINAEVNRQYNCPNNTGMILESNGGSGTALSHWAIKTAKNELMTAGVSISNPTISYITLSLFQETGWYRTIYKTYGSFINFGYQKGCSMLNPLNCSSN
jgi:leishmanolysin